MNNPTRNIDRTINHLFRQESGKMVAVLVKLFGPQNLEMAEDVVQDALIAALETWKYKGIPDNPRAWLYRTAKNKAIDILRRNRHSQTFDFSQPEKALLTSEYTLSTTMEGLWKESQVKDDFLAMMYACCRPEIAPESQITFVLKSLCGFSTREVARAFMTSEETISKRIYRTKEFFRKSNKRPEIPPANQIASRTKPVLSAIYLIFNEGFNSTHSDNLIREDLISQAFLLGQALLENPGSRLPEAYALMSLMCLHAARADSRLNQEGELVLLPEQDRSNWNQELIAMGNDYLNQAAFGDAVSTYHLEAAIAYEHCSAKSFQTTNWEKILEYYDSMLKISLDPVVYLNRCLALLESNGPAKALEAFSTLHDNRHMQRYSLYHAGLGEIHLRLGNKIEAQRGFKRARELTLSSQEKKHLEKKLAALADPFISPQ